MLEQVNFHKLCQVHSQNYDEDLILGEILRKLGLKKDGYRGNAIELMGGNGIECNTSRLALDGWRCLIFDGNQHLVESGKNFWSEFPEDCRPTQINAWVTRENVVNLVKEHFPYTDQEPSDHKLEGLPSRLNGLPKDSERKLGDLELDVFSLDMDGMDFWVLKSLYDAGLRPKVLILEIQEMWTDQETLTLEYQPGFWTNRPEESGCSLNAFMELLGNEYLLVACISKGFNVFLVRRDLDPEKTLFGEMDPKVCFRHHHGHFEEIMKWRRSNVENGHGVGKWINPFV